MVEPTELSKEEFDRAYERMSGVFADIRGQVQFAEAKNGALFASIGVMPREKLLLAM